MICPAHVYYKRRRQSRADFNRSQVALAMLAFCGGF